MVKALRAVPLIVALAAFGAAGCSSDDAAATSDPTSLDAVATSDPTSLDAAAAVCQMIVDLGVGANCTESEPEGLGIGADEKYEFELPSVPGESGQVLVFSDSKIYDKTVAAYDEVASLAGPHRYGSSNALVFVQINEGLSAAEGQKVEQLVSGL
ncbi:hypothetical protein [Rhodococcus sp. NPDC058481]|uniref:hypothetical protein n=1 Tax=unclassified Rhodococcus (in: high G+C Gram-positive bacteria) TaxID=192944 RepID=UPI00365E070A